MRHIRAHGNWLAPRLGLFDVWTWIVLFRYVTSTAVNLLLIPLPWVLGVMGLTMMIPGSWWDRRAPLDSPIVPFLAVGLVVLLALFALSTWAQPRRMTVGAEFKGPLYSLQKSALVLVVMAALAGLSVLSIAAAYALESALQTWLVWIAGLSVTTLLSVGATIYGFFTGGMSGGVSAENGRLLKRVAGFLVGILGYVALALLLLVGYYALDKAFYSETLDRGPLPPWLVPMTAVAWALAVSMLLIPPRGVQWFLNTFSLQALYRRGLRKAYILRSVTREEKSRGEDRDVLPRGKKRLLLKDLFQEGQPPPDMPYHLIVTAINTSGDDDLERLGRRSDGLVLAPIHSGARVTGYQKTRADAFKEVSLSQAMATSGAAQSPNMGRATTTSMAILMSLFNVRIGTWILNPDKGRRTLRSWRPLAWFWLKELTGTASAKDWFVYLTDGGHFDNSGIYELLKRRCKYIVAVDSSRDIGNLATVARLARIDLGIQIDVDLGPVTPDADTKLAQRSFAVGRIKYPSVPDDTDDSGVIVWIRTVMTPDQRPDLVHYQETDSDFPFHSTGDQFFDQSQFESYRQLGHAAAGAAFPDARLQRQRLTRKQFEDVMDAMLEEERS